VAETNPPTALGLVAMALEKDGMVRGAPNKKRASSSNSRKGKGRRRLLHSQTEGPPVHHRALRTDAHNHDIMFNAGNVVASGEQRALDEEEFSGSQARTFDQRPQLLTAARVN